MENGRTEGAARRERDGIPRCDERDTLFARRDLFHWFGPESAPFQEYYRRRPEHRPFDESIAAARLLRR